MSGSDRPLGVFGHAGDDTVVPFEVAALDARGRAVQLGPVIDAILERHDYPDAVARLLAEATVLAVLLGSSLKFEGKFILQTQTDGPVDMLVADFTTPGSVRAYARFDPDRVAEAIAGGAALPEQLLGSGTLAMTIDQGTQMQRYQGIVRLEGQSLEDVARVYFRQSEQIPTDVRLAVAQQVTPAAGGGRTAWRAGGIIAQFLPDASDRLRMPDLPGGDGDDGSASAILDDAWSEVVALLATIEHSELFDPTVGTERLLFRLFHEHGVRVFEGIEIRDECSCSRDRIRGILDGFSADEIAESTEDGRITVSCEFCSTVYSFEPSEFEPADRAKRIS